MGFLVVLAALAVLSGVAVAAVVALRTKAAFERSNELIPGVRSAAPASWAGSHEPEARLHRRLRQALAALRANQAFDHDGSLLDLRVELEQQAVEVDQQLVATAALPVHLRSDPLERLSGAVASLEQAVADLAGSSAAETSARLSRALDDVRSRTGLVAQARAALDDLPALASTPAAPESEPEPEDGSGPETDQAEAPGQGQTGTA